MNVGFWLVGWLGVPHSAAALTFHTKYQQENKNEKKIYEFWCFMGLLHFTRFCIFIFIQTVWSLENIEKLFLCRGKILLK